MTLLSPTHAQATKPLIKGTNLHGQPYGVSPNGGVLING